MRPRRNALRSDLRARSVVQRALVSRAGRIARAIAAGDEVLAYRLARVQTRQAEHDQARPYTGDLR